jgi:hypothetical protein
VFGQQPNANLGFGKQIPASSFVAAPSTPTFVGFGQSFGNTSTSFNPQPTNNAFKQPIIGSSFGQPSATGPFGQPNPSSAFLTAQSSTNLIPQSASGFGGGGVFGQPTTSFSVGMFGQQNSQNSFAQSTIAAGYGAQTVAFGQPPTGQFQQTGMMVVFPFDFKKMLI